MSQIKMFVDRLVQRYEPEKVILFGSYAHGTATNDSDVDLFVIMPKTKSKIRTSVEIRKAVPAHFPLDIIVRSPAQVAQRLAWNDYFVRDIVTNGKILYEAAYARVD
ncbi:MAG: nucleotidyltransferase domain-containing protein [Candidatus Hydrogenedentes bacterium]|nr:nucleotidyltransferase domain-containing protein [Candidatus Hydrogenedentota bacterium]